MTATNNHYFAPSCAPIGSHHDSGLAIGAQLGVFIAPMKTYSEKLRDPRWHDFRRRAFNHHGFACETCGVEDKPADDRNHIHHKRYLKGREPWEYDMDDVRVLCSECHEEIHECENKWRDMIRSMPAWMVFEFNSMADAFKGVPAHRSRQWASYCKNQARALSCYPGDHEN